MRITEKKVNDKWLVAEFENLKHGDIIRFFDDKSPVVSNGKTEFVVEGEPFQNEDGIWQVNIGL